MSAFRISVLVILLVLSVSEMHAQKRSRITSDSVRAIQLRSAQKQRYLKTLDTLAAKVKIRKGKDNVQLMIEAEYALFQTLLILGRTIDGEGLAAEAFSADERLFWKTDSSRDTQAGKLMNGLHGMYRAQSSLYRALFAQEQVMLDALKEMQDSVDLKLQPSVQALDAAATLGDKFYKLTRAIADRMLPDSIFQVSFEQIDQQYVDGQRVAEMEEDLYLNSLYRSFEVMQLWAYYLDPKSKADISEMFRRLVSDVSRQETITAQLSITMRYVYWITEFVARKLVIQTL